jgi:hypothetical protein
MNMHRAAAAVTACCLAVAAVTACSAGITSGSGSSGSSGAHQDASIGLGGALGSFPIPQGATVISKITTGHADLIVLGQVKAVQAAGFYTSVLPGHGYTISTSVTGAGGTVIVFSGHGYQGELVGAAGVPSGFPASPASFGLPRMAEPHLSGNDVMIMLKPH